MSSLMEYVLSRTWAITPTAFGQMFEVLLRREDGVKITAEEVEQIVAARDAGGRERPRPYTVAENGVALVPITGFIERRASLIGDISGPRGTSVDRIRSSLRAALEDPEAHSVLFDIDSPGGVVAGIADLADEIRAARKVKPIFAYAAAQVASAAYWLAAQAQQIFVGQTAIVGSIGVFVPIRDASRAMKDRGVDLHVVKAGENKGPDAITGGFTEKQRDELQVEVNALRDVFVSAVAAGRGIGRSAVLPLADGSTFMGNAAIEKGLADEITTFEDAVARAGDGNAARATQGNPGVTPLPVAVREARDMGKDTNKTPATEEPKETVPDGGGGKAVATKPETTTDDVAKTEPKVAADLMTEGAQIERKRQAGIRRYAAKGQEQLVETLIESGVDEATAKDKLHADLIGRNDARLEATRRFHEKNDTGADEPPEVADPPKPTPKDPKAAAEELYASSAKVQEHFSNVNHFVAYVQRFGIPNDLK